MFTGIVEEIGIVKSRRMQGGIMELKIGAKALCEGMRIGDSIAVAGVCLTVVRLSGQDFSAEVMQETQQITTLGTLRQGSRVNLERSLRADSRIGGHFVTGHIDGVGKISEVRPAGAPKSKTIAISAERSILSCLVQKGSVSVDGVSLTVGELKDGYFTVHLIPHTLKNTTFGLLQVGDSVNIECDILAKHAQREKLSNNKAVGIKEILTKYGYM